MKKLIQCSLLFIVLNILASCNRVPDNVTRVLGLAGTNRSELEKVMNHYKANGEREKLKAAYFLIGNMEEKFSYDGDPVKKYDILFMIIDTLHKRGIKISTQSPVIKTKWDSLVNIYGKPKPYESRKVFDYTNIKAQFIIENIDNSYAIWKENPTKEDLSFDDFCNYILFYRIGTERLEPWKEHLKNRFKPTLDTIRIRDRFNIAKNINAVLRKTIALNHTMAKYPFDMTAKQMEMIKRGACKHLVYYEAMVLRANGIPVALDKTPLWGDMNRGHHWLSLILEDGKMHHFNAAQDKFGGIDDSPYRFAKVYRSTIEKQNNIPNYINDIPVALLNNYTKDVTEEYTKAYTLKVKLKYKVPLRAKHALICTFGRKWQAQDWGNIEDGIAKFENMGSNLVYIVMYYMDKKLSPATDPFILTKDGDQKVLIPSRSNHEITVERKYPNFPLNIHNASAMVGGKFQVANRADFSDAKDVYIIPAIPERYYDIEGPKNEKFRYVRYFTKKGQKNNLAEMEIYELVNSNLVKLRGDVNGFPEIEPELGTSYENAFDDNPETYFSGNKDSISWAGLDLKKSRNITKIRFYPRSDTNFILPGDEYELLMWEQNTWISINKQVAKNWRLKFRNVPHNALLILRNLSRGKEERIFTYENGKQVWW